MCFFKRGSEASPQGEALFVGSVTGLGDEVISTSKKMISSKNSKVKHKALFVDDRFPMISPNKNPIR